MAAASSSSTMNSTEITRLLLVKKVKEIGFKDSNLNDKLTDFVCEINGSAEYRDVRRKLDIFLGKLRVK